MRDDLSLDGEDDDVVSSRQSLSLGASSAEELSSESSLLTAAPDKALRRFLRPEKGPQGVH